jgi:hypothetical protein
MGPPPVALCHMADASASLGISNFDACGVKGNSLGSRAEHSGHDRCILGTGPVWSVACPPGQGTARQPKKPLQTLEFEFSNTENGPACFYLPWAAPGRLHTGPVRFVAGLRTQGHSPLSGRSQAASAPDQSNQPPPWWSKIRFAGSPVAVGVSGDVPVHLLGPGVHTGCVVGVVC